jgi:hypothetical protein
MRGTSLPKLLSPGIETLTKDGATSVSDVRIRLGFRACHSHDIYQNSTLVRWASGRPLQHRIGRQEVEDTGHRK